MLCLMFTTEVFFHYLKQKELHMIATLHIIDKMNFLEHGVKARYLLQVGIYWEVGNLCIRLIQIQVCTVY